MVTTRILPSMASFHAYAKKEEIEEGEVNHDEDYCSLTYKGEDFLQYDFKKPSLRGLLVSGFFRFLVRPICCLILEVVV